MNYDERGWRSFLTESRKPAPKPKFTLVERRLLRELDDEEVEHIRDAIDTMGPEELAFNSLFEGKTRLVLDFPTMDTSGDLGKFVDSFRRAGYDVDWEKGLISGERELKDGSISAQVSSLMGAAAPEPKKKKVQMKIGKFFGKIYELTSKRAALSQKVFDHLDSIGYTLGGFGRISEPGMLTGKMIAAALDEEEQKRYQQLHDQLVMYLGGLTLSSADAKKMQVYWQQNADYIKKNINNLSENKYSIIVTRDPIDILRMSDFDRITSCHTPPSRGGGDSYYKCAVAEAHGHGAIAYAVETEELLHATNTSNIESAEQEINNDDEIFADDTRGSHVGLSTELLPVARLRLRQVRAYFNEQQRDTAASLPFTDVQVAVPETRVYGIKIPGFRDRVFEWAKSAQAATIEAIPEDARWIKYGGSYEDSGIGLLLGKLTGREIERVGQDTQTEDSIDDDVLLTGLTTREQVAVDDHVNTWNDRYQACEVAGTVEDDGGGSIYVDIAASMLIKWDVDEWESLPTDSDTVGYWVSELNDMGWGWADSESRWTRIDRLGADHRLGDQIIIRITIDPEGLPDFGAQSFAYNSDNFEDFCVEVNAVDDLYDAVKQELETMAKRDGLMEGGALNTWGMEIINGEFESYEWDLTAEEGYEHNEIGSVEAAHTAYPDIPDGMSVQDARTILESRDFTIPVRTKLVGQVHYKMGLDMPHEEGTNKGQFPGFGVWAEEIHTQDDENIRLVLTFDVNDSSSDEQVEVMKMVVEVWDDEEELDAEIQKVFNKVVGDNIPVTNDRVEDTKEWDEESEKRFQALAQKEKESSPEVTNESIVKNWKNFLYN